MSCCGLCAEEGAVEVDIDDTAPLVGRCVEGQDTADNAGEAAQGVDTAKSVHCVCHCFDHLAFSRDVNSLRDYTAVREVGLELLYGKTGRLERGLEIK